MSACKRSRQRVELEYDESRCRLTSHTGGSSDSVETFPEADSVIQKRLTSIEAGGGAPDGLRPTCGRWQLWARRFSSTPPCSRRFQTRRTEDLLDAGGIFHIFLHRSRVCGGVINLADRRLRRRYQQPNDTFRSGSDGSRRAGGRGRPAGVFPQMKLSGISRLHSERAEGPFTDYPALFGGTAEAC